MCSSKRTPWVQDFCWPWNTPGARGRSCPLMHDLVTVCFLFQIGVFCPISPSWAQAVTTITRHHSSLVQSFYGPTGVPIVFQPFINPLNNLWKKLGRTQQNESKYQQNPTIPQSAGFKPALGDPSGFLVHCLNHPATTTADVNFGGKIYVDSAHKRLCCNSSLFKKLE